MSRRMQVLRIVAAGTMAAAISSFSAMTAARAADTIKIGSVLSVTGPASFLGDPEDTDRKSVV